MRVQTASVAGDSRRTGRPPKMAGAIPTSDRLIAAAMDVFAEQGFSGANITDIAARAGISGPAVYKHFDGKADLLMQAARRSLDQVAGTANRSDRDPRETARRWLSPEFAQARRLILELHLAADREHGLADLLAAWHVEQAGNWQAGRLDSIEQIKAFYLLLLGLSQLDALASLSADPALLQGHIDRMVDVLFTASTAGS